MLTHLLSRLKTTAEHIVTVLGERQRAWTQPLEETFGRWSCQRYDPQ